MSKSIQLTGIGSGLVDILVEVEESFLEEQSLAKAGMSLVSDAEQANLIKALVERYLQFSSGGSVANSVVSFAGLGGKAGLISSLGNDDFSNHFVDELNSYGIAYGDSLIQPGHPSGTCLVLITPDAERTMCTALGANNAFGPDQVDADLIAASEWVFIEGYLLANPKAESIFSKVLDLAKANDSKIAITLSADSIVNAFKSQFEGLLAEADLVFANLAEAQAFTGETEARACLQALEKYQLHAVVTASEAGSYIHDQSNFMHIPAIECKPVDLTGAGDAYAAGYLYGIVNNFSSEKSAKLATSLAHQVITRVGSKLEADCFQESLRVVNM